MFRQNQLNVNAINLNSIYNFLKRHQATTSNNNFGKSNYHYLDRRVGGDHINIIKGAKFVCGPQDTHWRRDSYILRNKELFSRKEVWKWTTSRGYLELLTKNLLLEHGADGGCPERAGVDLPRTDKGALLGSRRSHPITRPSERGESADKKRSCLAVSAGIVARLTFSPTRHPAATRRPDLPFLQRH